MASTSVSEQTAVTPTFGVSSHARKPSRNLSLSCCLLTTAPFSPTQRKPYSTSSTTSLMQPRTLASPSAWRRLRYCTNPLHVWHTVLISASMAPTQTQCNTSLTWVASSPMTPQSARILTTACSKLAVPLEDCQIEYGRATRSTSPRSSRYTGPSSLPPSCTVQRPGFSIGSRSGYWSGFTNAACAPSLASNGKTTCRTKKSSREPVCPA